MLSGMPVRAKTRQPIATPRASADLLRAAAEPLPDEFALRQPYKDCGMDTSLEVPGGHSGLERDCLVDANAAGTEAERRSLIVADQRARERW